jgi:hypothetical protein
VTGLDDNQILSMLGVRTMSIGRHDSANSTVIKGENVKVLGYQYDWIPLTLVRAQGT